MTNKLTPRLNLPTLITGLILVLASCAIYYSFGSKSPLILKAMDHRIMDIMFNMRGPVKDSGQVMIVDIDERSLKRIGQWPWSRDTLARLTRKLKNSGAKAIGFDVVFAEKDRTSPTFYFKNMDPSIRLQLPEKLVSQVLGDERLDYDAIFAQALSEAPTVLGYAFQTFDDGLKSDRDLPFPSGNIRISPPSYNFKDLPLIRAYRAVVNHPDVAMAESEGFFNMFPDAFGTTRKVPLIMMMDDIPYPSLALETYRVGTGAADVTIHLSRLLKKQYPPILGVMIKDSFIPTDIRGNLFVNYRGPGRTFQYISALKILKSDITPEINDKFVLIGSSSTILFDLRTTPFSLSVPGVEINATIIDNLIRSDPFIYDVHTEIGLTYTYILCAGLLLTLILAVLGPLAGGIGGVFLIGLTLTANYYFFFLNNRHVGMMYPMLTCLGILLITSVFNAFRERKTKQYIRKAFTHYVSGDVVQELIKNPKSLSLQGQEKELTVLFCDIRGFTTLSETLSPSDLGNFMNAYLTRMSRIIIQNKGTVDKFIGDAVMAFWGAPNHVENHALSAVKTAIEMKNELIAAADELKLENIPNISVGIGINTGLMSVGNFGSKERFDYTVMGDNVNLASRLEGANKNYGTTILISDITRKAVETQYFCRYIDKVQVKGRNEPVDLFEPVSKGRPDEKTLETIMRFETAVKAYQQGDFKAARQILVKLHNAKPSRLYESYIERIDAFMASGAPPGWKGIERRSNLPVNKLTTK